MLPPGTIEFYRRGRRFLAGQDRWPPHDLYERLYQIHSVASNDADAVGLGSFDAIGRAELAVLQHEGMGPGHTLVDFGCGTGRLAVHAIPALPQGHYIGIDISTEMLRRLDQRIRTDFADTSCRVSLLHQTSEEFPLPDRSVDMLCAFSVFTHMEHEDTYRYLLSARRVLRPGGRLVFSCLPLETPLGEEVFKLSASVNVQVRWSRARSVATSQDLMREVARLAGWRLVRWYRGDEENVLVPGSGERLAFGQSIGVLE